MLTMGKKLRIKFSNKGQVSGAAAKQGSRSTATSRMFDDLSTRLVVEEAANDVPALWKRAYEVSRCSVFQRTYTTTS